MRITYDPKVDAASVRLSDSPLKPGSPGHAVGLDRADTGGAMIFVHFDGEGFVVSIEILDASRWLRPDVLASTVPPDTTDVWKQRANRIPRPRPEEPS
jgi:uncharacterized protein YuzE